MFYRKPQSNATNLLTFSIFSLAQVLQEPRGFGIGCSIWSGGKTGWFFLTFGGPVWGLLCWWEGMEASGKVRRHRGRSLGNGGILRRPEGGSGPVPRSNQTARAAP